MVFAANPKFGLVLAIHGGELWIYPRRSVLRSRRLG